MGQISSIPWSIRDYDHSDETQRQSRGLTELLMKDVMRSSAPHQYCTAPKDGLVMLPESTVVGIFGPRDLTFRPGTVSRQVGVAGRSRKEVT